MKIKVSEATNPQLNWLVGQCEERAWAVYDNAAYNQKDALPPRPSEYLRDNGFDDGFLPTTNWAQGGPIIDRQDICFTSKPFLDDPERRQLAHCYGDGIMTGQFGATKLVAAMRRYVAGELGDEVEVPDELV